MNPGAFMCFEPIRLNVSADSTHQLNGSAVMHDTGQNALVRCCARVKNYVNSVVKSEQMKTFQAKNLSSEK